MTGVFRISILGNIILATIVLLLVRRERRESHSPPPYDRLENNRSGGRDCVLSPAGTH
jgi:hypothetical protein